MSNAPHLDCNCPECVPLWRATIPSNAHLVPSPPFDPWREYSAMIERGRLGDALRRLHDMPYNRDFTHYKEVPCPTPLPSSPSSS